MRRAFLALLIGAAILSGIPAQAFWQSRDSNYNISIASGSSYTGPLDVVSGAKACYALRGCSASESTGLVTKINVRRASDNTTENIVILSNGNLDLATMDTFAGVDATANCTIATTSATCTSASSTPHTGSTLSGSGITQPCYVTAVSGTAPSVTLTVAGGLKTSASAPCGTVSVAVSTSLQYGLYLTQWNDGSGNAVNVSQATASDQPQVFPNNGLSSATAAVFCNSTANTGDLTAAITAVTAPQSSDGVWVRTNAAATTRSMLTDSSGNIYAGNGNANVFQAADANSFVTGTANDNLWHTTQAVLNGASPNSGVNIDGSFTTGSTTARAGGTTITVCATGGNNPVTYITQLILWQTALSSAQYGSLHTNDSAYWSSP